MTRTARRRQSAIRNPQSAIAVVSAGPGLGIQCPMCGCRGFEVLQTRRARDGRILRRRRCCRCGARMTTSEHRLA
jgi:hypothetical protein